MHFQSVRQKKGHIHNKTNKYRWYFRSKSHQTTSLKKPGLDKEVFKKYRPVSNLPFVSKIVEKVVAKRIEHHLDSNFLHDNLQSAYRSCHSTETALPRVHHDIATALDNNWRAVLVMLDLSAAFDVIDRHILFRRLENTYGIAGSALCWIKSYLKLR